MSRVVTRPLEFTVATSALLLDQVTARPVRVLPLASLRTALNGWLAAMPRTAAAGLTVTEATCA